jgi:hypothetical protein
VEYTQIDKRGKLMSFKECQIEFDEWIKKHGVGNCDAVIRAHNRRRVNPERDPRDKTSPSEKQKMFNTQKGFCPICHFFLYVPATDRRNEVDHIDPNRQDFNHQTNKQLVHGIPCNRKKSSKDLIQQSKESGKTIQEIIEPGYTREQIEEDL